jgi:anti-sigma-K factor RskA
MKPSDDKIRFDELSAGCALGDLSRDEAREFQALMDMFGENLDPSFEFLATAIQVEALASCQETLPTHLRIRLDKQATAEFTKQLIRPHVPTWKTLALHPLTGWAAAAAVLIISLFLTSKDSALSPALAAQRLRTQAADLLECKFDGLGNFKQAGGSVIWSDQAQQGYMILTGLPVNDPRQAQYQLWIVDPSRDADAPVDGGVFNIPADGTPVIIPIAAKLALAKPQAFVITLEQPGGVVKSKQERVVCLAKS